MFNSNSHKRVLSNKQQNSILSSKMGQKAGVDHLSQSNQKSMSLQNSQTNTVSYSQLQIILENVQNVKKKAGQQIQSLQKKNLTLEEQVKSMRQKIKRYQNIEQAALQEKIAIENQYTIQISSLNDQLLQLKAHNEQLAFKLSTASNMIEQKNKEVEILKRELNSVKYTTDDFQSKYNYLTEKLQINELSTQFKNIIKQYTDIPSMLQTMSSLTSKSIQQEKMIAQFQRNSEQMRIQNQQNSKVITSITQENKHLLKVIEELNEEKRKNNEQIKGLQQEKQRILKQKQNSIVEIQDEIMNVRKQTEEQITRREKQIDELLIKVRFLEKKMTQVEKVEKQIRQQQEYKAIVDQVCDEYSDYENVIKRIQYLEKYRSQYYFNIEKIQYLCKILDS